MFPGMGTSSPSAQPMTVPGGNFKPEEDKKCEVEREYREEFSKSILLERLKQYYAGKLTRKYIDTYLEFCVLSGYLSNLDYLDIKEKMSKE